MVKSPFKSVKGISMPIQPLAIPDFDGDGYLPEGVYPCTEEGLDSRFVQPYAGSSTRQDIYDGFMRWRCDVRPLIDGITQWVDGSFVTNKVDPADIDVVSFCDTDYYNTLDEQTQAEIDRLLDGQRSTKTAYSTHTTLVLSAPLGHPDHAVSEFWRKYYRKYWTRTYTVDPVSGHRIRADQQKGFLTMTLGDDFRAPVIATERPE